MASSSLREIVKSCAEEFGAGAVWLFGTSLEDEELANDIDLAVEGLDPECFFEFYRKLYFSLPKPVDLVDLSLEPPVAAIIRKKGVRIYERRA